MKRSNLSLSGLSLTGCLLAAWLGSACDHAADDSLEASAAAVQALTVANSGHFIVTRLDQRKCASPVCGGYFVKSVNQTRTRCANGSSAADCHAFRLDFGPAGLSADQAARFEAEFFAKQRGLVRGSLISRSVAPNLSEDVLVVTEAWQGQAMTTAKGTFNALTATGRVCITFPCDSFQGEKLNTGAVSFFNAVDLAASGAPPEAVAQGQQALAAGGVLSAGAAVTIVGPAGRGSDFRASEFYLRLPGCIAQDAAGVGACARFFGYAWNGRACVGISGCSCKGVDCKRLSPTAEACQGEHQACGPRACGSRGLPACADKKYCDFPAGGVACGHADGTGVCRPKPEICLAVYKPVCGCDGKTHGNSCEAAAAGTDVASEGACNAGGTCRTDADCRALADTCTGCDCRALSICEKPTVCPGPGVQCLVDPCFNQQAVCDGGRCALRPAPADCAPGACGPQLGLPNQLCPDGQTVAGPTRRCLAQPDGTCGWQVTSCPDPGFCAETL